MQEVPGSIPGQALFFFVFFTLPPKFYIDGGFFLCM